MEDYNGGRPARMEASYEELRAASLGTLGPTTSSHRLYPAPCRGLGLALSL